MTDAGGTTYDNITYSNIKATASTGATPQTWTLESDMLLSSTSGTLYGYYPYSSSVTDITQVPVTAGDTDYMYATPVTGLDDGKYTASVTMNHALAAIRLNVVRGTYTGTGSVTAVSVKGDNIATSGKLNAKTGALTGQVGAGTAITYSTAFTLSTTAKQIDQIMVPITSSSAAPTFTVTIDGKEYTATPAAVTLAQGMVYEYTLTVNAKEISLSDVKVGDWGYNSSGNPVINARYNITLAGDLAGIAFSNAVNDDGWVTIEAVPKIKNHFVSSISSTGTASVKDALDRSTGIRTITVNTVETDVTINFTSTYLHINADNVDNGLYAITADGELLTYNDASDETCIGVALIVNDADTPQRIMIEKNGEANTTSIKAAYEADGAINTDYIYFYWGPHGIDIGGITNWTEGYFSSIPTDYKTWKNNSTYAWNDYNGKTNTAALMNVTDSNGSITYANAATYCAKFNETKTENQGFGDWYIPACGQLALIYINVTDINAALTKIGGTTISTSSGYISSSEHSSYNGWYVPFSDGSISRSSKIYERKVRLVRDLNPTIQFYINGALYTAEEGMTWGDWCNSSYNKTTYGIVGNMIGTSRFVYICQDAVNWESVDSSETIVPNWNYCIYEEDTGHV